MWPQVPQQRAETFWKAANPTENDAPDVCWYISQYICNVWPVHYCCLGLFEI